MAHNWGLMTDDLQRPGVTLTHVNLQGHGAVEFQMKKLSLSVFKAKTIKVCMLLRFGDLKTNLKFGCPLSNVKVIAESCSGQNMNNYQFSRHFSSWRLTFQNFHGLINQTWGKNGWTLHYFKVAAGLCFSHFYDLKTPKIWSKSGRPSSNVSHTGVKLVNKTLLFWGFELLTFTHCWGLMTRGYQPRPADTGLFSSSQQDSKNRNNPLP